MIPRIQPVKSYEEKENISSFVHEILESYWESVGWDISDSNSPKLVVVKPNWIQESHEYLPGVWQPVITHPDIVISVVQVLAELMRRQGIICVCDAPITYANFAKITTLGDFRKKFDELKKRYPALNFELLDLRREIWTLKEGVIVDRRPNSEDPRGYVCLNLSKDSHFWGYRGEGRYYGADYDRSQVRRHHLRDKQEYLLSGTAIKCDLFVNLPKLKTHSKAGITCSLKNLVGINGDKNWLPHYTEGSPKTGGDEFPKRGLTTMFEQMSKKVGQSTLYKMPILGAWGYRKARTIGKGVFGESNTTIRNGNWCGNDTCWRMALDINRALLYGNPDGTWRDSEYPKQYLTIVDGIIGGEGNGPLCPDDVQSKVLIAGGNPATVDAVACRLMGFDSKSLPILREAFAQHRLPIADHNMEEITVVDERVGRIVPLKEVTPAVTGGFKPHFGWIGQLERNRT
jgi:uncharacterized protein (DUF362 family)